MRTTIASPAAPPTTPPAIVPAGGALLLAELEFEAGSVLVGASYEVAVYWLVSPPPPSVEMVENKVCLPLLDDEPDREPGDDTSLTEVVDAAATVKVLSPKVVV